jgi:hypothetical protein
MPRFVFFEPEDLWSCPAWKHRVTGELDCAVPTKRLDDRLALLGGRHIAPELGGSDYPVGIVQNHQTVLLTAHPDCTHVVLAFA